MFIKNICNLRSILSDRTSKSKLLNITANKMHIKCRNGIYPLSNVTRLKVPDNLVDWAVPWPEYRPPYYTAACAINQSWSDPNPSEFSPSWNALDNLVNRVSFEGVYNVDTVPLNPRGRTGLSGRGLLGRWGPNHAADPIITRWRLDEHGCKTFDSSSGAPILEFVAIKRRDCGEWAIPGGMVDPGEKVTNTLRREFQEEALNSLKRDKTLVEAAVSRLFENGRDIYKGYVDDHRNTDNSWMETVACNFHDNGDGIANQLPLEAGDDAGAVTWMGLNKNVELYADHQYILALVAKLHEAHW